MSINCFTGLTFPLYLLLCIYGSRLNSKYFKASHFLLCFHDKMSSQHIIDVGKKGKDEFSLGKCLGTFVIT